VVFLPPRDRTGAGFSQARVCWADLIKIAASSRDNADLCGLILRSGVAAVAWIWHQAVKLPNERVEIVTDYTIRRRMMVDTQVRPSDVTRFPIIDAMLRIPREEFVPDALREAAYVGENLDIGQGRVMLEPRTLAKMLELADLQPNHVALDIGCGLGYSTAILASLCDFVVAVEDDTARAEEAQSILSGHGVDNAAVMAGPLVAGAPKSGPYDVIFVQGAVEHLPDALLAQLREGGRIICIFAEAALGVVRVGYKIDDVVNWRFGFNAGAPVLTGFHRPAVFAL
jgi:protein-L-isoaspartate(D-aspartate) O-methyltransferase